MDHLGAMLNRNLDNLITGEIGSDRGILPALANDVCLIGLCGHLSATSRANPIMG